jgi:tight adherence protein B
VMAINIQRNVGGNLAELLETVANTIRERQTLRRQVRVLSAEGRLSAVVLTVLPFFMALYLYAVRRDYLQELFKSTVGIALLIGAGILMLIGNAWMRKVVRIDV